MRRPVAMLAAAYAVGIFIERFYPASQLLLYGAGACALAAAIVCIFMRRAAIGAVAIALLAAVLGALAYVPFHTLPPSVRQLETWLHRPVVVEAAVVSVEPLASGALRLKLRYDSIETAEEQFLGSGLALVTLQKPSRQYCYGQRVRFNCRLRRPRNFNNPGSFDYERFLAHRNIYLTAFLDDDRTVVLLREDGGNPLTGALERYRSKLRRLIWGRLEAPERDMVLALLLGEKQTLDPQIREQVARLGVAHLLAISGLHIGIVAALAFALACFALRRYSRLLLFVDLWKTAALVSIFPVVLYCCVAGLQIPTLRAGIMIVVCIIALLINRRQDVFNALALACCIILIWMPTSLFEISFQLSVTAVFFLIVCAPHVQKLLATAGPSDAAQRSRAASLWLYRFLGGILTASLIATVVTAPLTAFYFQQFSLAGILANCLLVPAIGFGAVPCALLAAVLFPLSETAAAGLLHAAALILEQALLWIRFWSDAPLTCVHVPPPSPVAMGAYFSLLCLLLCSRKRWLVPSVVLCAVVVLCVRHPAESREGLLCITFLDVGHGDATVIQFPRGEVMLIDSGGLRSDRFDTGESIVAPALMALGIRQVTWLVISHPHHDHMAGMPYILEYFQPAELWVPGGEYPDPFFKEIVRSARRKGLTIRTPARDTEPLSIDGVVVEFLSPDATQAATSQTYHDLNDSSLVMKISYGSHAFLFTGDIGARQEELLLEQGLDIHAQVLKVPHHGKRGSSTQAFLDAVNPERAIFSCRPYAGSDISADVLERYRSRGVQELRTDLHGALQINSNGTLLETYTFMPYREFRP